MPVTQILTTVGRISGPVTTYTLTPEANNVDEGTSLTFDFGGTNVPGGTYYWTIETNAGDFATTSGTVEIPTNYPVTGSNLVSFTVTPTADATTEGSETFTVALRSGSITGTILVTSAAVTINDTSFAIGGQYVFNGTPTSWATTNATATTYGAYTYPDGTSGSLHTLTGSQFVLSGSLGKSPTVNINLWFYPTANNKLIMGEVGQSQENTGWHYSMLEIDSTNHLKGRIWEMSTGTFPTSVGTVTLNAWNHVHLYFDNSTSTFGMSLNNETAVTQGSVGRHVPDGGYVGAYYGIGMYETQFISAQDRYEGKFAAPVIDTTLTGSNYSSTKAKYIPPLSLVFNQPQGDYLSTPASADWNLGTTWTIEFWLNANSSGYSGNPRMTGDIWGLLNQEGWGATNAINIAISDAKLIIGQGGVYSDVRYTEPTPAVWTHVAVVNDAGTQKVFYNGVQQTKVSGTFSTANYTNSTDSLAIGNLAGGNNKFDGKMALVRISNAAKYSTAFTPVITYGVEADTKLFLSLTTPLVDSMSHTITNSGVSLSTDVPVPLSLQFVQSQTDYLDVAASSDWALNRTWTIEWWSKASKVSTEGDLLTVMCQDYTDGNSIQIIYQAGTFEIQGTNRIAAEPTPGVWTHVALVNTVADGMTLYYNGVSQYTGGYWSLANNTNPIRIGARGLADFQRFDGQLALIRISNTAKYTGTFTPTKSYGVESDTKLFLGKYDPLVDAKGHAVTNHGVTTNTDFPT